MSGRSELLVSAMRASSFCGRSSVPICMSDTTAILYPSNEAGRRSDSKVTRFTS